VKAFLRALVKGLKETARSPSAAVESVIKRNDTVKRDVELERLRIALDENILTPEVKANGYGEIDPARFDQAIDQIALTYAFKARPKTADVFDQSFLPDAAERKVD
jgi:NitT/TauT family transport system substrate-binding protein